MYAASTLLAGYLLAVLPALLVQNPDRTGLLIAALHVGAALLLLHRARHGSAELNARAWLPLLLIPALYAELPLLNQWRGAGYHDAAVLGWEAAIFTSDPSSTWAGAMPWLPLSEILHAGYVSYYPLIYLPFIALHLTGRTRGFGQAAFAVLLAYVTCWTVFILFPVQGPRYLQPAPAGIPSGVFRGVALFFLESGSSRGAAFPSSHVAIAATQALVVYRWFGRRAGLLVAGVAVALGAGAVYGGFHYAVDVLVGAAVGAAAFAVALRAGRGLTPDRQASPLPEAGVRT